MKRLEELHPRDSGKGVNVVLHGDLPQEPAIGTVIGMLGIVFYNLTYSR